MFLTPSTLILAVTSLSIAPGSSKMRTITITLKLLLLEGHTVNKILELGLDNGI